VSRNKKGGNKRGDSTFLNNQNVPYFSPPLFSPDWLDWVHQPQSEAELAALRKCIERGTPDGKESWQHAIAARLGLETSLHPRGRPRSQEQK
jgi:hypothetical protein